jgi:hypothetical protein
MLRIVSASRNESINDRSMKFALCFYMQCHSDKLQRRWSFCHPFLSSFYCLHFLKIFKMKNMHMNNDYIHVTTLFKNFQKVFVAVLKKFKYGHFIKKMLINEELQNSNPPNFLYAGHVNFLYCYC